MSTNRWIGWLLVIAAAVVAFPAMAAEVEGRVDRNQVHQGETLRFMLKSDSDGEPDFKPLEQDFDVLGTSKSRQMSIVNGNMDSRTEWAVTLAPKRLGNLVIPSIKVGDGRSKPVTVTVSAPDANATGGDASGLFIEAVAEPKRAYVQSQIVVTVRLFQAVEIREAGLSEPKIANAVVERLGEDAVYTATRTGRQYRVTERRYAVFPQTSGKLTIPAVVFAAQVVTDNGLSNAGPDPFSRFFQQPTLTPVRLRSEPITLDIRPQPDAAPSDWWLPAESVTLTESWAPEPPIFRVGDSVTRTITLEARGLTGAQLPEIQRQNPTGMKAYPDKPVVETRNDGSSLRGVRQEKLALVPTQPGEITLPEVRIQWWDTRADKAREARLPARTITVLPAANAAAPKPSPTPSLSMSPNSPAQANTSSANESTVQAYIPWTIAGFFGVAWLATVLAWWSKSRRRDPSVAVPKRHAPKPSAQLNAARQRLFRAAKAGDAAGAKNALLDWAAARWPNEPPMEIAAIAHRLNNVELATEIDQINRTLYGADAHEWQGGAFWRAFERACALRDDARAVPPSALPELYPR